MMPVVSATMATYSALGPALHPSRRAAHHLVSSVSFRPWPILRPGNLTAWLSTTSAVFARARARRQYNKGKHRYEGARTFRDNNRRRGESALRGTGLRRRVSVSDVPLPRPVSPRHMPEIQTSPTHGLWDFFYDRGTVAQTPESDAAHGRAWTVGELRNKSWEDLHKLWWVCVKERNRIATASWERRKSELGFGDAEGRARDAEVKTTMKSIMFALTERYYNWEDALALAKKDPEINLTGIGPVYKRPTYVEEVEDWEEGHAGGHDGLARVRAAEEENEQASALQKDAVGSNRRGASP